MTPRKIRAQPAALKIPRKTHATFNPRIAPVTIGSVESDTVRRMARECGFELAGVARAEPIDRRRRALSGVDRAGHGGRDALSHRPARGRPPRSAKSAGGSALRSSASGSCTTRRRRPSRKATPSFRAMRGAGIITTSCARHWSSWRTSWPPSSSTNGKSAWIRRRCWNAAMRGRRDWAGSDATPV